MGQRDSFSANDVTKLNRMYNCKSRQNTYQSKPAYQQQQPYYGNYNRYPSATGGRGGYGFGPNPYYPSGPSAGALNGPSGPSGPSGYNGYGFGFLGPLAHLFGK